MYVIFPLILGLILYLIREDDIMLLLCNIVLIFLYLKSIIINSEIIIIILLILLNNHWMLKNSKNIIIGSIFTIGSIISICATSIISLFIGIEIISLTIIIIINLYINDKFPGIIYYLFSGLFSGLFILSIGYISIGYSIFYKLLYIVFIYKLGLFPFHILLPNIYNNISPTVLLIIDIPYKILLFYILYKTQLLFFDLNFIIIINLIASSIGILRSKNVFFIMIYSAMFNYSLILILIIYQQLDYFLYYLFIYSFSIILFLFLITHKFINRRVLNKYYLTFWFLLLINLIGIPPLNGFFIKFNVLYLVILNNNYIWLILILISFIFLTYIYTRILISLLINDKSIIIYNNNIYNSHFISTIMILTTLPILL